MGTLTFRRGDFVIVECIHCSNTFEFEFTEEQERAWRKGALIQSVAPHLTCNERELLISQICGNCFDNLCGETPLIRFD